MFLGHRSPGTLVAMVVASGPSGGMIGHKEGGSPHNLWDLSMGYRLRCNVACNSGGCRWTLKRRGKADSRVTRFVGLNNVARSLSVIKSLISAVGGMLEFHYFEAVVSK